MASFFQSWRTDIDARTFVQAKIFKVKAGTRAPEGIKYSLVLIRDGIRLLGYDNHGGKGHRKHLFDDEEPYEFVNVNVLIADFRRDVYAVMRMLNEN